MDKMDTVKIKDRKQMDMLNGGLISKILWFALPLAASSILQQLFNSVDVAVVGKFASSEAQAAVGCNGSVINLLLNLFVGISVGANVVIANCIGRGEKHRISKAVHTAMVVALISGIFLLVLGMCIAKPMLILMDTPVNILDKAVLYLRIYFLGMPFIMIYNFGAAVLRSMGDTKRPLYCLMLSGVVNAGLNMVLVIGFGLDVAGVAIATVTANIINAAMVLYFLLHEQEPFKLNYKQLKITKKELVQILKIGVPAGLQSVVFSIANVCIQTALNGYGSDAVAGSAVALNFEYFTYFVISAFNQATVTFTSQNYGAGKYDRCKRVFRMNMLMSIAASFIMSMIFLAGQDIFVGLFTSEPPVAAYAKMRMKHIMTLYILMNFYEISGAALRGLGYSMTPALLTIIGTCVLRLGWVYTVCRKYKDFGLLMDIYPISWGITGAAVLISYFIIRRRLFAGKTSK